MLADAESHSLGYNWASSFVLHILDRMHKVFTLKQMFMKEKKLLKSTQSKILILHGNTKS